MHSKLKSLTDIRNLEGKVVILRADYNVHFEGKKIKDTERIVRTFATIDFLIEHKAKVIIVSHLGRPHGEYNAKYSLQPVAKVLSEQYPGKVHFCKDSQGIKVDTAIDKVKPGTMLILENVRFYAYEEANDELYAKRLARHADYFVNDAFGVSHRRHATVHAITKFLDSYAGFNLIKEVTNISKVQDNFKKPAAALIGGVKISTKIKVIEKFVEDFEYVCIGGALANNFLKNMECNIGQSYFEGNYLKMTKSILNKYGEQIVLPEDFVISSSLKEPKNVKVVSFDELCQYTKKNFHIVDIGPKTIKTFKRIINESETLVWNGPMGLFEVPEFSQGTQAIAKAFARHVKDKPYGLVGGGETIAVINQLGLHKDIDFISTGGGAMLAFIENGTLPALEKLVR
jgi:phosphoglycerate kinase